MTCVSRAYPPTLGDGGIFDVDSEGVGGTKVKNSFTPPTT